MANSQINNNPNIDTKDLQDVYVRKNFQNLQDYFNKQNQLYNFQFFEFIFTKAQAGFTFNHGCTTIPQDIICTQITGAGTATFNNGQFTLTQASMTVTGPCRIRFFIGTYWNYAGTAVNAPADTQSFSAGASGVVATSTAVATTTTTASSNFAAQLLPPTANTYLYNGLITVNIGLPYYFAITAGNASAGATYTNNGFIFTVQTTVTNGTLLFCTSNSGGPTLSGTLSKASGVGDNNITFSAVRIPLYALLEAVAGGGGSAGSANGAQNAGGGQNGTSTTFTSGSNVLTLGGGLAGSSYVGGGTSGGTQTGWTFNLHDGAGGQGSVVSGTPGTYAAGGTGGSTPFGGGGQGAPPLGAGYPPPGGTGAGAGGAGAPSGGTGGGGGGAGSYARGIFTPTFGQTFAILVGVSGQNGGAGTSGFVGAYGSTGRLELTFYWQ